MQEKAREGEAYDASLLVAMGRSSPSQAIHLIFLILAAIISKGRRLILYKTDAY